jgi:hypothetical protein
MERLPGIARDRSGPGGRDVAYGRSTVVAMILIFGFRVRGTNVGEGEFFCPHCGADRHYVMRALRRWFTFFFIPIFPSGKELGRQVVCSTCNTAFREDVLNAPTSSALSDHIRNAMRVASVAMLRAGGETSAARAAASDAIRATGFTDYDDVDRISLRPMSRTSRATSRRWRAASNSRARRTSSARSRRSAWPTARLPPPRRSSSTQSVRRSG